MKVSIVITMAVLVLLLTVLGAIWSRKDSTLVEDESDPGTFIYRSDSSWWLRHRSTLTFILAAVLTAVGAVVGVAPID